jgi:hypothetical protein
LGANVTVDIEEHVWKASVPSVVTDAGMSTEVRPDCENAWLPMDTTEVEDAKLMVFNVAHPVN